MIEFLVWALFLIVLLAIIVLSEALRDVFKENDKLFVWFFSTIVIIILVSVLYLSHYDDVYTKFETVLEVLHVSHVS